MKRFFPRVLIVHLILSISSSIVFSSEVCFFDVGQGNCTLVTFNSGKSGKKLPPLLVDSGSSCLRESLFQQREILSDTLEKKHKDDKRKYIINDVASKILESINLIGGKKQMNVVVSHGDADHINLISDIVEEINKKAKKKTNIFYYLGGGEDDYKEIVGNFVSAGFKLPLYTSAGYECVVLESLGILKKGKKESVDVNTNSIVLRIKNNKNSNSIVLTGDATKRTTDSIIKNYLAPGDLKTTILQASHHGADSHGSNSADWFSVTSPQFVVISTGTNDSYDHPRQKMIKNALESKGLRRDFKNHFLQYYSDWPFIDTLNGFINYTIGQASSGYLYGLTELGVFSTVSQGNITVDLKTATPSFTFSKSGLVLPDSVYDATKIFLENTNVTETTSIVFPKIDFAAGELSKFNALIDLMILVKELISCDLSRVSLDVTDAEAFVAGSLFDKLICMGTLRQLDLPICFNTKKTEILTKWKEADADRRGLRIIDLL